MMRPVRNREEYLALRNSEPNRKLSQILSLRGVSDDARAAAKRKLVQMNYSASALSASSEDAGETPLKGCKAVGNSVGMDIDLCEADFAAEKVSRAIQQRILGMKEALGLLMLEESATKGYHIVFKRHAEKSQEENLRWASSLLGVEYDKGAKDITRVFFTPADKLLFLDDEIFVQTPVEELSDAAPCVIINNVKAEDAATATPASQDASTAESDVQKAACPASPASLRAFDLCVQQAGLSADAMDVWGKHNWHSNLMAVLSVGLPKLMNKEQMYAVVSEKLPNYSQTDDCKKLIDYFYEKYEADNGYMSQALREINAKSQRDEDTDIDAESEAEEEALRALVSDQKLPDMPKRLPRLMDLLVGNYDSRYRAMLLISSLPELSALASHFRARYINGRVIGPQQFVAVIGSSGSGKGCCTELFRDIVQNTLHRNDEQEWEKVRVNAELRDKLCNAKERPAKYHPRLRLFETTSKSSILELQTNLGRNGMLLGQFSEVDGLSGAARVAYSDISVLLRKAWDGDTARQYYMSDSTCNTYIQLSMSLLMAGTVKAMLERMFNDKNCEGGLMQRFIPVLVPKTKRTFRPPKQNFLTDDEKRERDALLMQLYDKDLALGDDVAILDTPLTNRAIERWFDGIEERYNNGELTEAEADLSHRIGEFILRAAIPLIALYGEETKEIVDFCVWVGDLAFYNMCRIFGLRVQQNLKDENTLLAERLDKRMTAAPLLSMMPEVFSIKEFKELREKEGQSTDVRMLLGRYCKSGKLERMGKGIYRKVGCAGQ